MTLFKPFHRSIQHPTVGFLPCLINYLLPNMYMLHFEIVISTNYGAQALALLAQKTGSREEGGIKEGKR